MSKASEKELADLHSALTRAYRRALGSEEVSPSLLTSVSNFLKHNNISCDPDNDKEMDALREAAKGKLAYPFDPKEANDGISH